MSNLSRGLSRDSDGDDEEGNAKEDNASSGGLNIPRFLDRQSNS
jgi:hypothetical protein